MLKKRSPERRCPFGGSPAQCVPVHFHHVVPAEHGVAFSPALWETSLSFLSLCVCVCVCVMLSSYVVPSFQRHKLPVLGPPAWIGHRDSVWHAWMNATPILYQNATNATPKACLLDNAGLPRGGHFLHFLFYFSLFLSFFSYLFFSFFLFKGKQSKCRPESKASTTPSFSFTEKFSPFHCLLTSCYLSFLPCFFS